MPGRISPAVGRGVEQLGAHGHEAVEEVGVQRVEAGAVGLQRVGEAVLGDQEVDEEVDPLAQRGVRESALASRAGPASAQASTWWR